MDPTDRLPDETLHDADIPPKPVLERSDARSLVRMRLELGWESALARHRDCLVVANLSLWRDLLPPGLDSDLQDSPLGHRAERHYAPGELVQPFDPRRLVSVPSASFDREFLGRGHVEPRAGRFYPRAILKDLGAVVGGGLKSDRHPCRLVEVEGEQIGVDLNHPLARYPLRLCATLESNWAAGDERGGRCNEVAEPVAAGGPGMQGRFLDLPTDFWSDRPFGRAHEGPDSDFYREPRLVDHLDSAAIAEVAALYGRLIRPGARILDLMSSWHSHLPETLARGQVVGLGMNAAELSENPALAERLVQDLNADPVLPFADGAFDACVCTVSVEYLTRPFEVFAEVARVLKAGAPFVVSFSNRWFPPKAIRLWEELHDFERPALVLEYFLQSEDFRGLETWSLRGLPRPADDRYADRLPLSDPIHAVWGVRG